MYDLLVWWGLFLLQLIIWLFITFVMPYIAYRLLSVPLRRQERAGLFLDVLQGAIERGENAEEAIVSLAAAEPTGWLARAGWLGKLVAVWPYHLYCDVFGIQRVEKVFGKGIQDVATRLLEGVPLHEAIEPGDDLLPPQAVATLRVGGQVGDIRRVLPACRQLLADAASRTRAAVNYLALIVLGASFLGLPAVLCIADRVAPSVELMLMDMRLSPPGSFAALWAHGGMFRVLMAMGALSGVLILLAALYIRRPRRFGLGRAAAWLQYHLPWRRKRLQRDFSAMLAMLLDAGVPEPEAVAKAAESTANHILIRRAARVREAMERGVPLPEALRRLDGTGEFQWRLANAAHVGAGFAEALAGWQQSLDAKAFQQEQAAAHVVTSAIAIVNGLIVAAIAIGFFDVWLSIVRSCLLW
ncbi:MAG: hypothetical protein FJ290_17695 [Planctomycetes bacterium]|nr:hypothetical protein [Planctomycetota bacterium]